MMWRSIRVPPSFNVLDCVDHIRPIRADGMLDIAVKEVSKYISKVSHHTQTRANILCDKVFVESVVLPQITSPDESFVSAVFTEVEQYSVDSDNIKRVINMTDFSLMNIPPLPKTFMSKIMALVKKPKRSFYMCTDVYKSKKCECRVTGKGTYASFCRRVKPNVNITEIMGYDDSEETFKASFFLDVP